MKYLIEIKGESEWICDELVTGFMIKDYNLSIDLFKQVFLNTYKQRNHVDSGDEFLFSINIEDDSISIESEDQFWEYITVTILTDGVYALLERLMPACVDNFIQTQ